MSTKILRSGCGIAEFSGTSGRAEDILKRYVPSLNMKCNDHIGITNAHAFVIMTMTNENGIDFCDYVEEHGLGKAIRSETVKNNNHYGWHQYNGTPIFAVLFTPNFEKLVEWYKQFDSTFELK